jgi:hypothetical protein
LRVVNLAFAATRKARLIAFPDLYVLIILKFIYNFLILDDSFTWALITICVHRLLLDIRSSEVSLSLEEKRTLAIEMSGESPISPMTPVNPEHGIFVLNGRASPFGFALGGRSSEDMHEHAPSVPVTMISMESFYR